MYLGQIANVRAAILHWIVCYHSCQPNQILEFMYIAGLDRKKMEDFPEYLMYFFSSEKSKFSFKW